MAGTPEISLMNFMIGQMARHYGIPWRTSNTLAGPKRWMLRPDMKARPP